MEIQSLLACPLAAIVALWLSTRQLSGQEQRLLLLAWVAHLAVPFAAVAFADAFFGGGDMGIYSFYGTQISKLLWYDPTYITSVFRLILRMDHDLPFPVMLEGTSTGTMSGIVGLLMWTGGESLYSASVLCSMFAFFGLSCFYRAGRWKLHERERVPFMVGCLLIPSAIFWTSAACKEAVVVGFFGALCWALSALLRHRRWVALPAVALCAAGVVLVKPYILMPFVLALAAWFYRFDRKLSPLYKVTVVALALAGLLLFTRAMPEFGVGKLSANIARSQRNFALASGGTGSQVSLGDVDYDDDDPAGGSTFGSFKWAPVGLFNSLLRPLPFDIRNGSTLVAASETTTLFIIIYGLLARHRWRTITAAIKQDAALRFAAVFVVTFGTAVGLATTNLGTLSRYRVPMIPIYVGGLLVLRARLDRVALARRAAAAKEVAATKPSRLALGRALAARRRAP